MIIFLLELAKVLRKLLVGLKSAYRFRQTTHIEDRATQLEGAPGLEDFRFRGSGGNRSDFQGTGLRASSARFFFHIAECRFEINTRFFHCVALGSLEDFFLCAG